jgi:hypothetical protein
MLCEYILKETIDRKGNFYNGAPWVHCSQKLETCYIQSSLVKYCCLRNLLGLLGWGQMLLCAGSFLMTPSKQALMSNLKLDVILFVYKCDLACLYLWCENMFVMSPYRGGCHILVGYWMAGCSPWWLPNPCRFQDAADKQAGYCRGDLCICNRP